MNNNNFDIMATLISLASILIATYSCYQTYKINRESHRSYVFLYIVSTKNATYIKVKNFGHTSATIMHFDTDIDVGKARRESTHGFQYFPLIGLENISLAPNTSKIALIDNKYLNKNHWMSVTWSDNITKRTYTHKIKLISFDKYALVHENDFEIIDF